MALTEAEIMTYLTGRMPPARLGHSRRVAATAADLARRHGLPPQSAHLAGLLHDLARDLPDAELLAQARSAGLSPDAVEQQAPVLLHGPLAAVLARRDLGVTDPEVLAAIASHTVGGPALSGLAKVVCLADAIEPGRDYAGVDELRALARTDLDAALAQAFQASISYVQARGLPLHPLTVTGLNDLSTPERGDGKKLESAELARTIARIAVDKKGQEVMVLDLGGISLIADYFVIASGSSTIQVQALARHIEAGLKEQGLLPQHREGVNQARWVLLDYGTVVVHIFLEEMRRFYDLERLWGDAKVVNWAV